MTAGAPAEAAEAVSKRLFFTAEGRANPYPLYDELRGLSPVHRTEMGLWLLSRYEDCWAALRDPRLGKDYATQIAQQAESEGVWDLRRAGLQKVKDGITSLEEVNRVTVD